MIPTSSKILELIWMIFGTLQRSFVLKTSIKSIFINFIFRIPQVALQQQPRCVFLVIFSCFSRLDIAFSVTLSAKYEGSLLCLCWSWIYLHLLLADGVLLAASFGYHAVQAGMQSRSRRLGLETQFVSKRLGLVSVSWKRGKVSVSISSRTENQTSRSRLGLAPQGLVYKPMCTAFCFIAKLHLHRFEWKAIKTGLEAPTIVY